MESNSKRARPDISYDDNAAPLLPFDEVALVPVPGDNCAIATRTLPAGTRVALGEVAPPVTLPHTVLVGHRFATRALPSGTELRFGPAVFGVLKRDVRPGEYLVNARVLSALSARVAFELPTAPNFADVCAEELSAADAAALLARPPAPQLALLPGEHTFRGFARADGRGASNRNWVAILPLTADLNAMARRVAREAWEGAGGARSTSDGAHFGWDGCDGAVALEHTEGCEGPEEPPNAAHTLRALAGLLRNPNVGGAVVLAHGGGAGGRHWLSWERLVQAAEEGGAGRSLRALGFARAPPAAGGADARAEEASAGAGGRRWHLVAVGEAPSAGAAQEEEARGEARTGPHVQRGARPWRWEDDLGRAVRAARAAIGAARLDARSAQPLAALRVAQQCGGSDAFSGVTANPTLGEACALLIRRGGSALLAETDELIGAEAHVLARTGGPAVCAHFLRLVSRFRAYAAAHGAQAEGNP